MRTFTREAALTPPTETSGRELSAVSASPAVEAAPPRRWQLPRGRPSIFILVIAAAGWELFAPPLVKVSALVGSVTGSMNAAAMRGATQAKADMDATIAGAVEKAKLAEQLRYQPLIGALDTAFKNCQVQTQALAQAQAQLIAQRAALTTDGVRGRMSSGGSFETMGGWLNGLSPGAGDGLREFGRAERNAAMAEFERQALAAMPQIQLQGGICGDNPTALLAGMGINASPKDNND